ncbi:MAG TPA: CoA pyrophosphatase [Acidimicrobiales bacterium]
MPDPISPQVIPRPEGWRPGRPAPWADLPEPARQGITIERVRHALDAVDQLSPVPTILEVERDLGPAILATESGVPPLASLNSAVLALLFEEDGEARLILTLRSSSLRSHRGQVSFPGGRIEEGEQPLGTALREANEEVSLHPADVTPIGWLHPVHTLASSSLILPVVATVPERPHLVASPAEVARIFDVALSDLADPGIFHEERWSIPGRVIAGSPDASFPVWFFEVAGEIIWGATARMIHELLSLILQAPFQRDGGDQDGTGTHQVAGSIR